MNTFKRFSRASLLLAVVCAQAFATDLITSTSASSITSTSATINWTTCGAANSQVFYGPDMNYGSQTTLDASLVTSHSEPLTGLAAGTVYHFYVISTDSSGNQVQGIDQTFTTSGVAPALTMNPSNTTVCNGAIASFTAAASGTAAPTVQWKLSTDGGSTYSNISGATSTTYSFTASSSQTGYKYEAVFTNTSGSATSSAATLTVNALPVVTTQPLSTTVIAGSTATFTAAGSGTPSPSVQWQVSTDGGNTWANVGGATSTTLNVTGTTVGQNGYKYRAAFTNSCGTVNSSAVTLTVNSAQTYALSKSASSAHTSGSFLQGSSLSGTQYVFTSLTSDATAFSIGGVTKVCYWIDDILMAGASVGCDTLSPFDFSNQGTTLAFVQSANHLGTSGSTSVAATLAAQPTNHNFMVVEVAFDDGTHTVTSVTNPANTFNLAAGPIRNGSSKTSYIFYKNDIATGAPQQTITAAFNGPVPFPEINVLEYSGVNLTSTLDVTAGAAGTSNAPASGAATTTSASELIFGAGTTIGNFSGPGSGFTVRGTPGGTITEDKFATSMGSQNAIAASSNAGYVMQLATFRAATATSGWDTTKVANGTHTITQQVTPASGPVETDTATFTVSNSVAHYVTLTWVKGTASNAVTYNVYRAPGACGGSLSGTRIASGLSTAAYTDSSVSGGTSYCYGVTQVDTVTIVESAKSNLGTAVIP